jgi:hypothetical protein
MSRRRVVLGVIAFIVAMTGAFLRPFEDRSADEVMATDQATSTTLTPPTFILPMPSVPPDASTPSVGGVFNIHCRPDINGPAQSPPQRDCPSLTTTSRP